MYGGYFAVISSVSIARLNATYGLQGTFNDNPNDDWRDVDGRTLYLQTDRQKYAWGQNWEVHPVTLALYHRAQNLTRAYSPSYVPTPGPFSSATPSSTPSSTPIPTVAFFPGTYVALWTDPIFMLLLFISPICIKLVSAILICLFLRFLQSSLTSLTCLASTLHEMH